MSGDTLRPDAEFNVDRLIPIHSDREVLVAIADLLTRELAELQHIRAALTNGASRSSVEVKTSTRGVDVCVKAYEGSDVLDPESQAVQSYFRVLHDINDRLAANFGKAVEGGPA